MAEIVQFPETRALAAAMMGEAQAISAKLGVTFHHPVEKRIAGAEAVGTHKTSMLQNLEAGREIETEAIIGSFTEHARMTNTPSPAIVAV